MKIDVNLLSHLFDPDLIIIPIFQYSMEMKEKAK